MKDIIGAALLDYYHGIHSGDIITETNISEEDILPLSYLFRDFSEMPSLEQKALQLAFGHVLDVGCGAGSHLLYLQKEGKKVTGIDVSEGAVEVCKLRGVKDVRRLDLLRLKEKKFDTILLLMNGTGIFQKLNLVPVYLQHLASLLHPGGQILIDSSDLLYMYDTEKNGGIWVPGNYYYGELEYTFTYNGKKTKPFAWLYLDEGLFREACNATGLNFEIVAPGSNYDYLARVTTDSGIRA